MSKAGWAILGAVVGLLAGGALGFVAGLAASKQGQELLTEALRDEKKADVAKPQTLKRSAFELQIPGNWSVNTKSEDYDPDHFFSVESPGQSFVMFVVFDAATDPKENVENQVVAHTTKVLKNATRSDFTRWGRYEGCGALLKGKLLGLTPGQIRIFSHAGEDRSVVVVQQTYDEDLAHVEPGMKLIESSFQWAPAK
jgi:hypothetical protein